MEQLSTEVRKLVEKLELTWHRATAPTPELVMLKYCVMLFLLTKLPINERLAYVRNRAGMKRLGESIIKDLTDVKSARRV